MKENSNCISKSTTIGNHNTTFQNSSIAIYNDKIIESVTELMKSGDIEGALNELDTLKKSIAGHHELFPYYRTEIIANESKPWRFKSVPNSQEAIEKYPPNYKGKLKFPSKYKGFETIDKLLEYSYINQEDIEVNIVEIKKMLGDKIDPYQELDAKQLLQGTSKIMHKEFPQARPMKLYFKDNSFSIDYLEIGLNKIENNIYFFNNKQQDCRLFFEFSFDKINLNCNFNIKINDKYRKNVKAHIEVIEFMKNVKQNKKISLKLLKEEIDIFEATAYNVNFNTGDSSVNEFEILKDLSLIEEEFNITFELEDFNEETSVNIERIKCAILGQQLKGKYSRLDFKIMLNKDNTESIRNNCLEEGSSEFNWVDNDINLKVLNTDIFLKKMTRTYENAIMFEPSRVIKKLEVCDEGDEINIAFVPQKSTGVFTEEYIL